MMKCELLSVGSYQTNCYIVWDENTKKGFLIDPGFEAQRIKKKVQEEKIQLEALLNTHGHIDHIGENKSFDLPIYIHKDDNDYLSNPEKNMSQYIGIAQTSPRATHLLEDNEEIMVAGITVKVLHTPGHTPGCVCYLIGECLFSGDTLFKGSIGRTDLPGGDSRKIMESIKNVIVPLPGYLKIYPGHGEVTTLEKEKRENYFLINW